MRLSHSSANVRRFAIDSKAGDAQDKGSIRRIAVDALHLSPEDPSHVLLPIIPPRR